LIGDRRHQEDDDFWEAATPGGLAAFSFRRTALQTVEILAGRLPKIIITIKLFGLCVDGCSEGGFNARRRL
jgi:hypothetical protein